MTAAALWVIPMVIAFVSWTRTLLRARRSRRRLIAEGINGSVRATVELRITAAWLALAQALCGLLVVPVAFWLDGKGAGVAVQVFLLLLGMFMALHGLQTDVQGARLTNQVREEKGE